MASEPPAAKRPRTNGAQQQKSTRQWKPKKSKREKNITQGSSEDVLRLDIQALLQSTRDGTTTFPSGVDVEDAALPEEGSETLVQVLDLSSTGDGLAMRKGSDQVYVVPFTVPGDTARVKVFRHFPTHNQTIADLISVHTPSPLRDDSRVQCKYFGRCGGCQFQMLDYPQQLALKRRVLEKAYRNFSNLAPELVPQVGETIGSPLQYGYRTKLTPHFDGPPGSKPGRRSGPAFKQCPDIGFMLKGKRRTLDIEDCPIGTDVVRKGMKSERHRMTQEYSLYSRGATLLLRENTTRYLKSSEENPPPTETPEAAVRTESDQHVDIKTCETNPKGTTTEYVDDHVFTNPANSFFQNNNSILPRFTSYIRDHILPPTPPSTDSTRANTSNSTDTSPASTPTIKYLIDAYSGSGLFTIALSSLFTHSIGIDIASDSIACARRNAQLNGLEDKDHNPTTTTTTSTSSRCSFIAADANELFKNVTFDPEETVVVLDPPRKGCDDAFLKQLRQFAPRRVVYVSCNVHTQARDVGVLVRGEEGSGLARYEMESLVGFDFFPQTGHVEGVAILNRVTKDM